MDGEQKYFDELNTRASSYKKVDETEPPAPSIKRSKRNHAFLKCKEHNPASKKNDSWTSENASCQSCFIFKPADSLPNGVLPTRRAIIEYLVHLKERESVKGKTETTAEWLLAKDVALHWIFCNVYPMSPYNIQLKVCELWEQYVKIKDYVHKKKGDKYWSDYNCFISTLNQVFDFIATEQRTKIQEKLWGCKMSDKDKEFYRLQCQNPPIGYCLTFVDKKWKQSKDRQESRLNRSKSEHYEFVRDSIDLDERDTEPGEGNSVTTEDPEFVEPPVAKKKYDYVDSFEEDDDDDMPHKYRYIRSGLRSVRHEFYTCVHKLKSMYHMSQKQAEAAVIEVGNCLFGRNWQFYDPEKPTNRNTLPSGSNSRRTEPYIEAMALAAIVEEVMSGSKVSVMYANDGSAMSGVGSYVVQSLTIDGVQRVLPSFSIFTETRESLKELEVMTLRMLSASVGYRYSEKQILERIDFVMTDSTSHNLTVMDSVCEHFEANSSPKSLVCNVHPLMMFQRKVKDVFQLIHDSLGKERLVDCFLVDVDFAREDFITKAIKCLTSFINKDYSAKPWNRQKHFDSFISPKVNESLSYKDHRFNRLFQCCMVLVHHIDDIAYYLDVYRNIINGISILDRSFVEMTLLKPVFCAAALIGIHITLPFQSLLAANETNYSTLLSAFPILYTELKAVIPEDLCTTTNQVLHFVPEDIFKNVLKHTKDVILHSIATNVSEYKSEVVNLLKLMLPKLADGFAMQRGKIFGFGPEAESESITFKISSATTEELQKLDTTSTHNLGEERSVGLLNYELGIRGKTNLETSSRKLILNKSFDLLEKSGKLSNYRSFRKASQDIKLMKIEWNEKMKKMEEEGNLKKDVDNNHVGNIMYSDLEYLKARGGPFTKPGEVTEFDQNTPESKEKNVRLYTEVRYAKNSCLSMKHTASVFRLKRDYKNLTSKEYVENLCQYLGDARSKTVLTAGDLAELLVKLNQGQNANPEQNQEPNQSLSVPDPTQTQSTMPSDSNTNQQQYEDDNAELCLGLDEHVAAVWMDEKDNVLSWFLGVVESISPDTIDVRYYHRRDKKGLCWTFPEDDCISLATPRDHIIFGSIMVSYMQTSVIRCAIDKNTVKDIETAFEAYVSKLA